MNINKMNDTSISRNDPRFQVTAKQQMAAACSGGIITSLLMTPLDVVKIRLQIQQKKTLQQCFFYCNGLMDHYCTCNSSAFSKTYFYAKRKTFNGLIDAFVNITRREGITSLWSGLSPTLVLSLPATVVYFVTYDKLKHAFWGNKSLLNEKSSTPPLWASLMAGCTARIWAATCVSPLELIRTKMQSQKLSYLEVNQAIQSLIRYHGFLGLWKGLTPTLLRDVPFSGIYWVTYESVKSYTPQNSNPFLYSFISGSIAGTVAAIVTTPFDVVKTVCQVDVMENEIIKEPPGRRGHQLMETLHKIYLNNGINGLFSGLTPRLLRVVPACAIMIGSFEYGKNYYFNRNVNEYLRNKDKIMPRQFLA